MTDAPLPAHRIAAPRRSRRLLFSAVSIGVAAAIIWGLQLRARAATPHAPEERPSPVSVVSATQQDMPVWINAIGSAVPRNYVTLQSRVDGELMRLHFREGDTVKAGQLLAEIDPRSYQATLTQAEGQLARDQALLDNAKLDLERYKTLWAQDSIARQQVDTQAALVRQYEGTVANDRGVVASARVSLDYTRITAPVSGRIGLRNVDPGNQVHSSDTTGIATIAQLDPMTVVFSVPETSLPEIVQQTSQGQTLVTEAWDRDQRQRLASGHLLTLDNQIDATTGTIKLKAVFANSPQMLFPNQFVNVRLRLGTHDGAIAIPGAAVQRGAKGTFIYVLDAAGTSAHAVYIEPGVSDGDLVEVLGDRVHAGEQVVVDGADRLRDGARVEIIKPADPAAAATQQPQPRRHKAQAAS